MSSAQIIQQADDLKASVADTCSGSTEAWVARQALQDLYQKLLVMDLEFALDKKVEQDLWNHAFKNQITVLQNQAKDKQNPKRSEIQASLNLFLETASGFYLQLLQELCSAFKLDLTFRRKSSHFGIFKEYGPINTKIRMPKLSSSMYICQHCLVHLGDIARYRQQIEQAQSYYRHAAHLVPYNGQPYNQLAILEAAKSNKLSTVYYYTRSIAVKHPFPVASTNLDKFYTKISKETLDYRGKLSMSETISTFLQFHAFVHLDSAPEKARKHGERLVASLPTHITSMSFTSYQLVQMVAINLFALHRTRKKHNVKDANDNAENPGLGETSRTYNIVLNIIVTMLEQLVYNTPKQEQKAKDYHTLPALKVLLDWLHTDPSLLKQEAFTNSGTWPHFSKLLNNLQFHGGQKDQTFDAEHYVSTSLPEDCDLQCFLPMIKAHAHLDFSKTHSELFSTEIEIRLRCHQLVQHGKWIADDLGSLGLLAYTRLKSGRLQFSAPSGSVKALSGAEGDGKPERKHVRQNVAIQAIMQKQQQHESVAKKPEPSQPKVIQQPDTSPQIQPQYNQPLPPQVQQQPPQTLPPPSQQQPQYQPFSQPYQYQHMAYQQPSPAMVGMVGDGQPPLPNPQVGPTMVQQNNMLESHSPRSHTPIGISPHGQIGSHPAYNQPMGPQLSPQTRTSGLISMVPPQTGRPGYAGANGNVQGMEGSMVGHKPFQQAPGAVRLATGPPSGSGSQFTDHKSPPPPMRTHQSSTQSPSSGRPILPNQYPSPSAGYNQGFQHSTPYSNSTNVGNSGYLNVGGMPGHHQMSSHPYNSSFPQARAPSPQSLNNPNSNPFLSLLGGSNLNPDFPLSQAMLALASSSTNMPNHRSTISQNTGSMPYPQLGEEDGGAGHMPYAYSNVGRMGLGDDGNQKIMLPREAFNKDEPELKFADLSLDAKSFSSSPGLNFSGLSISDQETGIPKPDSPNTQSNLSSLFNFSNEGSMGGGLPPSDNTYSLFSQSPWTVPLPKSESNKSLSSSPFGSGEDSLRNTPDPFGDMNDTRTLTSGFPLGYTFGSSDGNWVNPPSPIHTDENSSAKTLMSSSIQSLWSSGPSPLEKLLEQQKQQRHGDPL